MAYFDKYGVEFSDDRKTLVKCPWTFKGEYIIPDDVTSIKDYAFSSAFNLTSVTIPNSVTSIGKNSFQECRSLNTIALPNNVKYIGEMAFWGCSLLTSITIPNSVINIGNRAFGFCTNLVYIKVEKENEVYDCRGNCNAIINTNSNTLIAGCKETLIPNSVTCIGHYAFVGCTKMSSISIPNSVTIIDDFAFSGCSKLISVKFPNSITCIGNSAFSGCDNFVHIVIPNSVTIIRRRAFSFCRSLRSISIPSSVKSIGINAFDDCPNLNEIYIPTGKKKYFAQTNGLRDLAYILKEREVLVLSNTMRTWEEVNAEYRAYFEKRQKENPNIQNKNGGTPLEFPPFGIELSIQEYSQFKKEGRTIHSWMFWCKSGKEIHELARLYGPIGGIGLSTPRQGYYKVVEIEGEGNDTMLVCYYNLFSPNEFLEEKDEKVRIKQKPLFNKRSSSAGPIDIGDIIHVKSTELVEDMFDGRTYQAYKIIWEFV